MKTLNSNLSLFSKAIAITKGKFFLSLLLLSIVVIPTQAQFNKQWDKRFGGTDDEWLFDVIPTTDGGYVAFGYTTTTGINGDLTQPSRGVEDYLIVKIDADGNKQWDKRLGGSGYDYGTTIIQTIDGGYLVGGLSDSNISGDKTVSSQGSYDYWILKLDATGNVMWDARYGGNAFERLVKIIPTTDGGYLLGGESNSGISGERTEANHGGGNADYWVVKINSLGVKQWDRRFGGNLRDDFSDLIATTDGGYLLTGRSNSNAGGDVTQASKGGFDYWVVKIDGSGNKLWDVRLGGNTDETLPLAVQANDGGYLIAGATAAGISGDKTEANIGGLDYWAVKINSAGTIQWDKTYGGNAQDDFGSVGGGILIQNAADNFILGGYSLSGVSGNRTQYSHGDADVWLVVTDNTGTLLMDKRFGGDSGEYGTSLYTTADNGFILASSSYSAISGDKSEASRGGVDFWILRLTGDYDGDGITDAADLDDDNDGILDVTEGKGVDPSADADANDIVNYEDPAYAGFIDTNNDGINDYFDDDLDEIANHLDLDSDQDGLTDAFEGENSDSDGNGIIGIGTTITDTDNDGLSNIVDPDNGGTALAVTDTDGDGTRNFLDTDSDGAVSDIIEGHDADKNGIGDITLSNADSDKDGIDNAFDINNGYVYVVPQDTDGDGIFDYIDTDDDNDNKLTASTGTLGEDVNSNGNYVDDTDQSGGTTPNYLHFPSDADWHIVTGTADIEAIKTSATCYRLTTENTNRRGAIWRKNQIDLTNSFEINFDANFGAVDMEGADGLTFALQNEGINTIGSSGAGRGIQGVRSSVSVEFETYLLHPIDHVSIRSTNSAGTSSILAALQQASSTDPNIEDGLSHPVKVIWLKSTNTLSVYFNNVLRNSYSGDIVTNIFGGNPNVYYGFTAATGSRVNEQSVCNISYATIAPPVSANASVSTNEDIDYTFDAADITFNDADGHTFDGIQIVSVETAGDLEYAGADVIAGTMVSTVSQLIFKPIANQNGAPYATFTYKIRDSSGELSTSDYTMTINVNTIDDTPALASIEGTAINFTEDGSAVGITSTTTITDIDNTNLTGAVIQIFTNYTNGEDVLAFTNANGITGLWDVASGTLTLSGSSSVANYQTAIRSITYQNTNTNNPSSSTRTISFMVNDGTTNSNALTRNITITTTNDAPVLAGIEAGALSYNEDQSATAVTSTITVSDGDDTTLASATIQITGNYTNTEDVLAFTSAFGITGSWDAITGALTLSGLTTPANYQSALRNVTYQNTNTSNPATLPRTVSFIVNDGSGNSNTLNRNINVTAVNDAPTGANGAITLNEDTNYTFTTSDFTYNDLEGAAFGGIVLVTAPSAGPLRVSGITQTAGAVIADVTQLVYTPIANGNGNPYTSFTFRVRESGGTTSSSVYTMSINVTSINDAPVLAAMEASVLSYTENNAATIITSSVTVTDIDHSHQRNAYITISGNYASDQDVLSFTPVGIITGIWDVTTGTLTLSGSDTKANYLTALRSVTYRNTSNNPSTTTRTVQFIIDDGVAISNAVMRNIQVTSVNDTPVANNDNETTDEDTPVNITVLSNDTDADDGIDVTTVVATASPANGILSVNATTGVVTYTPNANYSGADSFTYTVQDVGNASSNTAMVSITITSINDAPALASIEAAALNYTEGQIATAITSTITVSDVDNANIASATVQITANHMSSEDVLAFTNANGITGSWNATSGMLTLSGVSSLANYQTALRSITYQNTNTSSPSALTRTFSFTINDGSLNSNVVTRNITITNVNDAPVLAAIEIASLSYTEEQVATIITHNLTVNDNDNTNLVSATVQVINYVKSEDVLAYTNANGITGSFDSNTGILTLTGSATLASYETALRSVTYQNTNHANPYTFFRRISFSLNDGVANSNTVTRNITITPTNDAPITVADNYAVTEGGTITQGVPGVLMNDYDPDNDLNISYTSSTIAIDGNVDAQWTAARSYSVNNTADPAYTSANLSANFKVMWDENNIYVLADILDDVVKPADSDFANNWRDDGVEIYIDGNNSKGTSYDGNDFQWVFRGGDAGPREYSKNITTGVVFAKVDQAGGYKMEMSIPWSTIGVTPSANNFIGFDLHVNDDDNADADRDGKRMWNDPFDVAYGSPFIFGTGKLIPPASVPLSAVLVAGTSNGSLTLNADGSFEYIHNGNENPSDSFTYAVNDGTVNGNTVTVNITITPVNDAPILSAIENTSQAYSEGEPAKLITTATTIQDADDINLEGATIQIVSNYNLNEDVLVFSSANGITGSFNTVTGVLTLTGSSSLANYQDALRSVSYQNTSTSPSTLTRTVSFLVNDGTVSSNTVTRDITINSVNNAPVATDDNAVTTENTAVVFNILTNDTDEDNTIDPGSLIITSYPVHGILSINNSSGTVTYSPNTEFAGTDVFMYTINDGNTVSNIATVTITVTPVNNAPLAVDDGPVTITLNLPIPIDVLSNDSDVDDNNNELIIISVSTPLFGTATIVDGVVVYQPLNTESDYDTFTYTIQDAGGLTSTATVIIDFNFQSFMVSEGFSPNNDGNNDTWYIRNIEEYPNNLIQVFDRWGLLVYKADHYDNTSTVWDGRANTGLQSGNRLDQGTYFYTLSLGNKTKQITGYVVIVQ